MAKILSLALVLAILGENEKTIVAEIADTPEAKATLVAYGFSTDTKYVRLSNTAHVALVDANGKDAYPHQNWFTKEVVAAFKGLDPQSAIVLAAEAKLAEREKQFEERKESASKFIDMILETILKATAGEPTEAGEKAPTDAPAEDKDEA